MEAAHDCFREHATCRPHMMRDNPAAARTHAREVPLTASAHNTLRFRRRQWASCRHMALIYTNLPKWAPAHLVALFVSWGFSSLSYTPQKVAFDSSFSTSHQQTYRTRMNVAGVHLEQPATAASRATTVPWRPYLLSDSSYMLNKAHVNELVKPQRGSAN